MINNSSQYFTSIISYLLFRSLSILHSKYFIKHTYIIRKELPLRSWRLRIFFNTQLKEGFFTTYLFMISFHLFFRLCNFFNLFFFRVKNWRLVLFNWCLKYFGFVGHLRNLFAFLNFHNWHSSDLDSLIFILFAFWRIKLNFPWRFVLVLLVPALFYLQVLDIVEFVAEELLLNTYNWTRSCNPEPTYNRSSCWE